jgi:uncharacterized membrane protein
LQRGSLWAKKEEQDMLSGLIALAPAGGMAMLARAVFGIVILCMAVPMIHRTWSSLRTRRPESGDSPDLNALWERYKRGEISWDEYIQAEVSEKNARR